MQRQAIVSLKHISITIASLVRTTTGLAAGVAFPSHLNQNLTTAGSREAKRLNGGIRQSN